MYGGLNASWLGGNVWRQQYIITSRAPIGTSKVAHLKNATASMQLHFSNGVPGKISVPEKIKGNLENGHLKVIWSFYRVFNWAALAAVGWLVPLGAE